MRGEVDRLSVHTVTIVQQKSNPGAYEEGVFKEYRGPRNWGTCAIANSSRTFDICMRMWRLPTDAKYNIDKTAGIRMNMREHTCTEGWATLSVT